MQFPRVLTCPRTAALAVVLVSLLGLLPAAVHAQIEPPGSIMAIQSGCVLRTSGRIQCFGDQYRDGNINPARAPSLTPVPVYGINNAKAFTVGKWQHVCALLADASLRCWGDNYIGQLGNQTTVNSYIPVVVKDFSGATSVAAGGYHTCASRVDGTVWCWGRNDQGQLAQGTQENFALVPVLASGVAMARKVVAGENHGCALIADGSVTCWGAANASSTLPRAVPGITTAIDLTAGHSHTCALLADGSVACWGYNVIWTPGGATDSDIPVVIDGVSGALAISGGTSHTCAVLGNGSVKCWGHNFYGQLGAGTRDQYSEPVSVVGIQTATAVAAGDYQSCVVLADDTVHCWGNVLVPGSMLDADTPGSLLPVPIREFSYPVLSAVAVGDINGNRLPEIALLERDPYADVDHVVIKDRRGTVTAFDLPDPLPALAMAVVADQNGNGAPELAILGASNLQARIHDSRTGAQLRSVSFASQSLPLALASVSAGGEVNRLALLAEWKGSVRVEVRDARTGVGLVTASFGSTRDVQARDFAALDDLTGDGIGELAVLLRNVRQANAQDKVAIRDGQTGEWIRNVSFGTGGEVRQLVVIPDSNHNGFPELGVLRSADSRVTVKDAWTGAVVANVPFNAQFVPQFLLPIPDVNGNGAAELGLVGLREWEQKVRATIKDLGTRQWLGEGWFGDSMTVTTDDFLTVADIDGNGAVEIVRVGARATDNRSIADFRDALTGAGSGHIEF